MMIFFVFVLFPISLVCDRHARATARQTDGVEKEERERERAACGCNWLEQHLKVKACYISYSNSRSSRRSDESRERGGARKEKMRGEREGGEKRGEERKAKQSREEKEREFSWVSHLTRRRTQKFLGSWWMRDGACIALSLHFLRSRRNRLRNPSLQHPQSLVD